MSNPVFCFMRMQLLRLRALSGVSCNLMFVEEGKS